MLTGLPPFMHNTRSVLYRKIKYESPNLNLPYMSDSAVSICFSLLQKNPDERLGYDSIESIMSHPWFKSTNWQEIESKTV